MTTELNKLLYIYKIKIISKRDLFIYKRSVILNDLLDKSFKNIYEIFNYSKMKETNLGFCSLYQHDKICHDLNPNDLSCFNCYCPNYILEFFRKKNKDCYYFGLCRANSEYGRYTSSTNSKFKEDLFLLNCSKCSIPHHKTFLEKQIIK